MPAMLRNLLVRAPKIDDLEAVTELLIACDIADYGMPDSSEEELLSYWRKADFNMESDAWVIVTTDGRYVGYGHVWPCSTKQNSVFAVVHPEYRNRGIGMLLLRLGEERAREQMNTTAPTQRVTLTSAVSHANEAARHCLEREGFTPLRQFWRLIVDVEEDTKGVSAEGGRLKFDLEVDTASAVGTVEGQRRTGIYVARQYDVYEKVLRAGAEMTVGEGLSEARMAA